MKKNEFRADFICVISMMLGGACIESTGVFFWIAAAMIVVPAIYIISMVLKSNGNEPKTENVDYLIDLATRNDMMEG